MMKTFGQVNKAQNKLKKGIIKFDHLWKDRQVVLQVTTSSTRTDSDNKWQQLATSSTMNDNEWQLMTTDGTADGKEW